MGVVGDVIGPCRDDELGDVVDEVVYRSLPRHFQAVELPRWRQGDVELVFDGPESRKPRLARMRRRFFGVRVIALSARVDPW